MVFGKRRQESVNAIEDHITQVSDNEDLIDLDAVEAEQNTQGPAGFQTETQSQEDPERSLPLLKEVIQSGPGNSKNPGGTKQWTCKHCNGKFTSSYTRIHEHFFGTEVGKKVNIKRCNVPANDRLKYEALFKKVQEAEKLGISKTLRKSVLEKKSNLSSKKPIEQAFSILERKTVDLKITRALCANGIPFNVLRNPQFHEMVNAIKCAPEGYKAPSSEKARTILLDECVRDVDKDLTPFKDTWYAEGVSIVSDGWSNVKHEPLINVIAVNSRGAMFMYAENFAGVEKTGVAIAEFLLKAIETVGPSNVLQVVTDNAANCKAAGKEIEKVHKQIFWSPCCVHTLNLIFKDFANEFYWLNNTYKRGKEIVKYFINHTHALAMFRENSKLELLKVAKTRFASHYILLRRLVDCREALATTISLNSWRDWVKKGDENTRIIGLSVVESIRSEHFWEEVESILDITKPIFLMIKFCDGEGPKMGEIYEKMDNMLGEIKDVMKENQYASYYNTMKNIVVARWEKLASPLHCLGFALSPKYYDKRYLEEPAPGGVARKAPNMDEEVVDGVFEGFRRISETPAEYELLRKQFAKFNTKKGTFSKVAAQLDAMTMDPIEWWSNYGAYTPELAEVAKKVLSQPISSSSAERNWSTYSYIHSVKRNRLNCKRADKLVFVHSNIRLHSRFSESYKDGLDKKWDINAEDDYMEGSNRRLEDIQWEHLDEEADNGKGKKQRVD